MHSVSDDPMIWESLLPYLKTLDKFVLAARAEEIQREQPENAVDENCIDAAAGDMNVTEIGKAGGDNVAPPAGTREDGGGCCPFSRIAGASVGCRRARNVVHEATSRHKGRLLL